jgi:hypothetical protein
MLSRSSETIIEDAGEDLGFWHLNHLRNHRQRLRPVTKGVATYGPGRRGPCRVVATSKS